MPRDPLAAARARSAAARTRLLERAGGALRVGEVAERLQVTPQAVQARRARGTLLALPQPNGEWIYPACQFTESGVLPGLKEVLAAFHDVERRAAHSWERAHLRELDAALAGFNELRAGSSGRLEVRPAGIDPERDPVFAPSRQWQSATPYQVTRHAKKAGAEAALSADVRAQCRRNGLPEPDVTGLNAHGVPGTGLTGHVRLDFAVSVAGPLLLGRSRHLGGGLFTTTSR